MDSSIPKNTAAACRLMATDDDYGDKHDASKSWNQVYLGIVIAELLPCRALLRRPKRHSVAGPGRSGRLWGNLAPSVVKPFPKRNINTYSVKVGPQKFRFRCADDCHSERSIYDALLPCHRFGLALCLLANWARNPNLGAVIGDFLEFAVGSHMRTGASSSTVCPTEFSFIISRINYAINHRLMRVRAFSVGPAEDAVRWEGRKGIPSGYPGATTTTTHYEWLVLKIIEHLSCDGEFGFLRLCSVAR